MKKLTEQQGNDDQGKVVYPILEFIETDIPIDELYEKTIVPHN
jgi:hypothetical protein